MKKESRTLRDFIREYRESILGSWLDIAKLRRDRRVILSDPGFATATSTGRLANKPLQFAVQALLLPSALLGTLAAGVNFFLAPPPPQLERAIEGQASIEKLLSGNKDKFKEWGTSETPIPEELARMSLEELDREHSRLHQELKRLASIRPRTADVDTKIDKVTRRILDVSDESLRKIMADLAKQLQSAEEEARRNRTFLQALTDFQGVAERWKSLVMSTTIFLNAFVFRWLVKKRGGVFPRANFAHHAYLLYVGAALLLPNLVGGILSICLDYAIRYDVESYAEAHNYLLLAVGIWALFCLRKISLPLAQAMSKDGIVGSAERNMIANRLIVSNLVSGVAVQVVVALIGTPIFFFILHRHGGLN